MSKPKLEQSSPVSPKAVVVGSPHFSRKFKFWAIVCAVIIVVGAVAGGWEYHAKSVIKTDNQKFAETQTATDALGTNNHFDQAASLWVQYAAGSPNLAHKGAAYTNAAALYLDSSQFSRALDACKKSEAAVGKTYNEVELAAAAARGLGDKATAIKYYQDALRLIPPSTTYPETQRFIFNLDIKQLQAKP